MNSAVITPCSHFFHAGCLKKWLYVQETCPLCHSQLKSQTPAVPNQDTPAANQSPAGQEEATASNKEEDAATLSDGGEEKVDKERDNGPATSAGETSSSSSSPLTLVRPPSASYPPVTDSLQKQLPADHLSASSSSDTLDMPNTPPCRPSSVHSSSQVLAPSEMTPAEPEPRSVSPSSDPPSDSDHPEEPSPPPRSL